MAARILAARRVVAYLPNLNAAVRHFTSFNFIESCNQSQLSCPASPVHVATNPALSFSTPKHDEIQKLNAKVLSGCGEPNTLSKEAELALGQFFETKITTGDHSLPKVKPSALDNLECLTVECDSGMKKDFQDLFMDRDLSSNPLSVLTLSQKTVNEMSCWSPEVEEEREQLLVKFIEGATEICDALKQAGFWADFIDPESGRPFFGSYTAATMFETDYRYKKLGFTINSLGCCKVIIHPVWGSSVYVGSLFTNAPIDHPVITRLNQNINENK